MNILPFDTNNVKGSLVGQYCDWLMSAESPGVEIIDEIIDVLYDQLIEFTSNNPAVMPIQSDFVVSVSIATNQTVQVVSAVFDAYHKYKIGMGFVSG